jgi:putative hemolysin/membrane-bound inhibitor of C-type lysozyme
MNKSIKLTVLMILFTSLANLAHANDLQLANPASAHCTNNGGQLELRRTPEGTEGICYFENGSECDEWAYFKGECNVGMRWVYQCDQGLHFIISFYDREQALLEFGDQEVKLKQARSGSGMRYTGGDITFTGKGLKGKLIMEDGKAYGKNCHVPVRYKE